MGFHKTPQVYLAISKSTTPTPHGSAIALLFKQTSSGAPCMPQDAPNPHQDQSQSVCPRAPQGNRSVSTLPKTWVMRQPLDGDYQHHDIATGGAQPKTHTTLLSKPTSTGQARTRHSTTPGPMGRSVDWVQTYVAKKGEPQRWWPDLQSLSPGQPSDAQVRS